MNFKTDITENEYLRESNYLNNSDINDDVKIEQDKVNRCDALIFIYPVFWTEAPAKLVGWFDRVWTYGFAYGDLSIRKMKYIQKSLILCITGHTIDNLKQYGHLKSMENVMISDRLFERVKQSKMHIFDGMTKANEELRNVNWKKHLQKAYELGLFINEEKEN